MDEQEEKPILYLTKEEEEKVWENIFRATRANDRKKRRKKRILVVSTFATIIFLSILGYTLLQPTTYTAESQAIQIVLSDKSEVTLFQGASLKVKSFIMTNTRDVYLNGDAIFKISKSKEHPFIVHTNNGYETKVLGTVFKVFQKGKTFSVDLFEGKVSVYRKEKPSEYFVLQPKETFSNMGAGEIAAVMKTENKTGPSTSKDLKLELNFTKCPFDLAIQTIEKNYGLKIKYPLELRQENISIAHNGNAEQIIKAIALQFNLNTKKNDATTFEFEK